MTDTATDAEPWQPIAKQEPWRPEGWEQDGLPGLPPPVETPAPKKAKKSARRAKLAEGETPEECEWRNNAEMIADVMALYATPGSIIVDVTFGKGKFWTLYEPVAKALRCGFSCGGITFVAHDKALDRGDGVCWDDLPEADGSVDIVVMDPDYVARGGRETSTIPDMVDAYGMDHADKTPEGLWTSITPGIDEAWRVLKPGGLLMLKCMNYISSATFQNVTDWAFKHFELVGFEMEDWAILVGGTGPQPKTNPDGSERRQVHLRQNASHLLIVRKPKPKRGSKS